MIGEISSFNLTFDGSNVVTEWFTNWNDSCTYYHNNTGLRNATVNFVIYTGGTTNITVIDANTISSRIDSGLTTALYRINGISFSQSDQLIETLQPLTFNVVLNSASDQPQGNTSLKLNFNDSYQETHLLYNEATLSTMITYGFSVKHTFSRQGNYSISATFDNEVDTKQYTSIVFVWDKLENVSFTSSKHFAKVDENITFSFSNVPNSNFYYLITYDDGVTTENQENDLSEVYSLESSWNKSYSSPNTFTVRATVFNTLYSKSFRIVIKVEYPILPDAFILFPEKETIPVPDGVQLFTLKYDSQEPAPTDMVCTFDFGDGDVDSNVSVVVSVETPYTKTHVYISNGTFHVSLKCLNRVSAMNKSSIIAVQSFNTHDFMISYGNEVKLMNMTTKAILPNATYRHNQISIVIPVDVIFHINLKNCSRMPPNIMVIWNFDDGVIESTTQNSLYKEHTFTQRRTHNMTFTFEDIVKNESHSYHYQLQIGLVDFTVNAYARHIARTFFRFFATGMNNAIYDFDPDSSNVDMTTSSNTANITYKEYGHFLPKVIARNGSMTEVVYLTDAIKADFSLGADLSIYVKNETIILPPGSVNISVMSTKSLPWVTCEFTSGDIIDKKIYTITANITPSEPMVFPYVYKTLGLHNLTMHCSNYVENITMSNTTLLLHNPCFSYHGIFDRNYALYENTMKAFTSADLYLSSRMQVICLGKTADFEWEFFRHWSETNKTKLHYTSQVSPLQGSNVIERGHFLQGIYQVTLNISLEGTWLKESMFIEFIKPPPHAFITGGTMRAAKRIDETIDIDAFTESYDGAKGYGNNGNLTFDFGCKM